MPRKATGKRPPKKTSNKKGNKRDKNTSPPAGTPPDATKKRSAGARNYCWTLNNPTEAETFKIAFLTENPKKCVRFVCWGHEVGEEDGTPHLQGYIELTKQSM